MSATDMNVITISDLKDMIRSVAIGEDIPVIAWGPSGVGKTEACYQVCAEDGLSLCDVRLAQYETVDFRGIPSIIERLTTWSMPGTLPFKGNPNFDENGPTILLFLDEINTGTSPATLALAYQLINERRVGEHELMGNVRIVAAANRESDRGVSTRMPAPLCARLCHVEIAPDVMSLSKHFASKGVLPLGIAFLNFRKPLVHTFDPQSSHKVFATPRGWERAFRLYAGDAPMAIKQNAIAGLVGAGNAAEFWGFTEIWSKIIPVREILKDPAKCRLPDEMSISFATAVNLSGEMTSDKLPALWVYLKRMDAEFIVLAWTMALTRDKSLYQSAEFIDFSVQYKYLLS